jgi:Effector Associated Constant Component 1
MDDTLAIELSEMGADPARLEGLTTRLRSELLDLDVNDVERVSAGDAPDGSRAIELAAVGALIVTMEQSGALVAKVVSTIREWLRRDPEPTRAVKITLGDRTIELTAASSDQQDRLVEEFVRAAGSGKDAG